MNKFAGKFLASDDGGLLMEHLLDIDNKVANGELNLPYVIAGLRGILNGDARVTDIPLWKTITMVYYEKPHRYYREELERAGCLVKTSFGGNDFWGDGVWEGEFDLVSPAPGDFGFPHLKRIRRNFMHALADERGLLKCPPQMAPRLRLDYLDQPRGEWLTMGMDPMNRDGHNEVFRLGCDERDGNLILDSVNGEINDYVQWNQRVVYIKPRTVAP